MVPFSYSRAMTSDVSRAPTIMMMTAMMPGTMKLRLSRSSLNQTRKRPSTGGRIRSRPWRFKKSRSFRSFAWAMKAVMKARVLPAVLGSLPSITTCRGLLRSALRSALQPGGMTMPRMTSLRSRRSVSAAVEGGCATTSK